MKARRIVLSEYSATPRIVLVDLTSDASVTAMYDPGDSLRGYASLTYPGNEGLPSLTINVINASGGSPLYMWTIIDPQSTDGPDITYKIYLHSYTIGSFWYWEDGNEELVRTVTITEDTTMNVYYTAPPKFQETRFSVILLFRFVVEA
jgi:hypothetical protein